MSDELSVQIPNSAEQKRLDEAREREVPWKQWPVPQRTPMGYGP